MGSEVSLTELRVPPTPPPWADPPARVEAPPAAPADRVVPAAPPSMFTVTSDVAPSVADAASPAARFRAVAAEMGPAIRETMGVLERGGLEPADAFELACCGASADRAKVALQSVLTSRPSLANYGPAAVTVEVLGQIAGSGRSATPEQMQAKLRSHAGTHVVRPDGYLAHGLSGAPVMRAEGLDPGRLYDVQQGLVYPRRAGGGADVGSPPLAEVPLDPLLAGRVLNGFEGALLGTAEGIAQVLTDPVKTVHDLGRLPSTVAATLRASPELFERFRALPLGAQVEAAAELAFTAALAEIGLGAASKVPGAARRASVTLGGGLDIQLGGAAAQLGDLTVSLQGVGELAPALAGASAGVVFASALGPGRGPRNSLPGVAPKAEASLKRAARKIDKQEALRLRRALPRIERLGKEHIAKFEGLLDGPHLTNPGRSAVRSARNAIRDHGGQTDLAGALRDRLGMPVREAGAGRTFDHAKEVGHVVESLADAREALTDKVAHVVKYTGAAPPQELLDVIRLIDELEDSILAFLMGPR